MYWLMVNQVVDYQTALACSWLKAFAFMFRHDPENVINFTPRQGPRLPAENKSSAQLVLIETRGGKLYVS